MKYIKDKNKIFKLKEELTKEQIKKELNLIEIELKRIDKNIKASRAFIKEQTEKRLTLLEQKAILCD